MPLQCVVIDDEPPALLLVKEYISKFPSLQLVATFNDGIKGAEFLSNNEVDLLFIDIQMPDVTGLDLVRSLQKKPMIIFTTAFSNFAIEGFELDAVDYLLKPISFERFSKAVDKAQEYFDYRNKGNEGEVDSLYVHSEYRLIKIPLKDIEYIESLEDYIRIHSSSQKPVMTLMTMKKVLEKLPESRFRRIHRSYIVATDKVQSIYNRKVKMISSVELPLSDSYLDFISYWKNR